MLSVLQSSLSGWWWGEGGEEGEEGEGRGLDDLAVDCDLCIADDTRGLEVDRWASNPSSDTVLEK